MMKISILTLGLALTHHSYAAKKNEKVELPQGLIEHTTDGTKLDNITDEQLLKWAKELVEKKNRGLTPEERRERLRKEQEKEDALLDFPPPRELRDIITLSLDPSDKAPTLYLAPGWDTHLSIIDANGSPWPIQYFSSGNDRFPTTLLNKGGAPQEETEEDEEPTQSKLTVASSKLRLKSEKRAGGTNLTLLLQGMDEIITIPMVGNTKKYHPKPVIQIPKTGPNSKNNYRPSGITLMSHDKAMRSIAMGGHGLHDDYIQIETNHKKVKAWKRGGEYFIRAPYHLKTPRPIEGQAGTGGYKAYRINYLPAITLLGDGNQQIVVKLFKNKVVKK
jgi:intracellular multiplication protein IcmK